MKFSFPATCACGETFPVNVTGLPLPKTAQCPKCRSPIGLLEPLGNVVGMAIMSRAATELKSGDWTLAIVLCAMAVECDLAYFFMKWRRIDLMSARPPRDADEEMWEKQWRDDARTIAARLDRVSVLLTGLTFDSFLAINVALLQPVYSRYPDSKAALSPRKFFVEQFFHRRNRIVHFGEIDFQQHDAELCSILANTLSQIMVAMDAKRRLELEAKHKAQLAPPPA